ncbi:unnamed protein product [Mytilus coruscus]|uniref:Uncharacterized protein n=1 Tax=Mytilus coruscus TaxID=42192 RepID=A0A6J8A2L3_MYTCO|nr:unnamed protein product [Mytilus coruscus]
MLQVNSHTNVKRHWDNRDINVLKEHLSSSRKIKLLRDVDLKVLIRFLKRHMKSNAIVVNLKLKESDKKQAKFEKLCTIFGYDTKTVQWKTTGRGNQAKNVQKLAEICIKVLQTTAPKRVLNIAHSEYHWIYELAKWEKNSTVSSTVKFHEIEPDYWFYHPEYSNSRQQIEVKCIDSTHLLTRARRKCCKEGLHNISNGPWLKVAKTLLSTEIIEDIIDPMSVSMATTNFSEAVENTMLENGDVDAASLCHVVDCRGRP